jgi:hypothetical protein
MTANSEGHMTEKSPYVDEMKLAAELVQHEHFMGRCEGGFPLLAFVEHCSFCGATYAEKCKRRRGTISVVPLNQSRDQGAAK